MAGTLGKFGVMFESSLNLERIVQFLVGPECTEMHLRQERSVVLLSRSLITMISLILTDV